MSILSTGEGYTPPSRADTSLGRQPLSRDGHCSGRYASYWNAILFCFCSYFCYEIKNLEAKSCAKRKTKRHVRRQCRATNKRCKSAILFVRQPHPNPEINRKLSQISCLCLHGFFYNKAASSGFFSLQSSSRYIPIFDVFKTERCLTFFETLNVIRYDI